MWRRRRRHGDVDDDVDMTSFVARPITRRHLPTDVSVTAAGMSTSTRVLAVMLRLCARDENTLFRFSGRHNSEQNRRYL